jgi:predicted nucleic acid-binding protein
VRKQPDRAVIGWIAAQDRDDIAISLVSVAELLNGISTLADDARRQELTEWMATEVLSSTRRRRLPVTTEILMTWLQLSRKLRVRGETKDPPDLLLAATAQTYRLTIVTRNTRHFANTGITVYNPWTNETQKMEAP